MGLYTIELWTPAGNRMADISALAHNKSYTLARNDSEQFGFDLDLYAFEAFCTSMGVNPRTLITPYQSDVRVKRNGVDLFGCQVVDCPLDIGTDYTMSQGRIGGGPSSFNPTLSVACTGYLDLFKDRYLDFTYTQQDAAFIGGDMLTQAQAAPRGNVGVTINPSNYMTGVPRDRTYARQNIKSELQNLVQLIDGRFDFAFSPEKIFNTYQMIGSVRTDIQLTFGGPQSNIAGMYLDTTATSLYNQVIALGSGFGPDQVVSVQDDVDSQLNNYLRQNITQHNSVVEQDTLDQDAQADLALTKDLLEIPQITITGHELRDLTSPLGPGDQVPLNFIGHPYLSKLNGLYRIEKMTVNIDDNDFEDSITLYFDNFTLLG